MGERERELLAENFLNRRNSGTLQNLIQISEVLASLSICIQSDLEVHSSAG